MTTANIKITKVLLGRGNTAVSANYTGVMGEVTMDTTLKTLRVHDGVAVGGTRLATYAELANVSLGNIDLAGYATTAQITAANAAITALQSNAAAQAVSLNTLTSNAASQQSDISNLYANAAVQATALFVINNTLTNQNNAMGALGASISDLYANAAVQAQQIANAGGIYGNSNVKSYLASFDGNINPSANVTYSLGNANFQWKDLWVSNATIYLNSVPLGLDATGNLTFDGNPLVSYINGNLSVGGNSVNINGISTGQVVAGNLILTLSDTTTINVGTVVGPAGATGATGAPGAAGATGPQGPQGNTGATGPQGIQGNTGPQGPQGIQGQQGSTGAQGISVTLVGNVATSGNLPPTGNAGEAYIVTTTGNLFFWNSNVGVWADIGPIVGPQGDPGPQGIQGNVGAQGATGPTGPTGPQGAQGPAGNTIVGWSVDVNNHLVPNTDNLQDLGTPTSRIRHIYVGPGSITVGSSVITESTTGKLVLPGVTRGINYTIDAVEEKGDQNYSFVSAPVIVDAGHFDVLQGVIARPGGYQAPEFSVDQLDDGEIDGITIDSNGAGIDQAVAAKMREFMRAYVGNDPDPVTNFNATDWIQIPFTVSTEAADTEYEFGADLGDFAIDGSVLEAEEATIRTNDGDLTIESDSDVFVKSSGGTHMWEFSTNGRLYLPATGTIEFPDGSIQTTANAGGGGGGGNIAGLTGTVGNQAASHGSTVYTLTLNSDNNDNPAIKVYKGTENDNSAISIGQDNGGFRQANVVAIGNYDVGYNALPGGVYIGYGAGYNNEESPQGLHAIAIGSKAAYTFATNNSITLNATGSELNPDESGLFIKPIRAEEYDDAILYYNPNSGEVTYANNPGTSTPVTVGNTAPGTEGALWYNTEDGRTYVYALDTWIDANPPVVPGNMVGYDQDGNITLNEDARINYANGVSIINSVYGDEQVAEFLSAITGNIGKIGSDPLVITAANIRLRSDNETWTFASDGVVVLPNGMTIASDGTTGVNATVTIGGDDTRISIYNDGAPPGLYITANATGTAQQWVFGPDGNISFPDGSTQTTAYTGGVGGSGNALVNGGYTVALEANGVLTIGANATISNDGEFRLWATDTDITVYRNGQDGYGVKAGNIETYTDNVLRTVTNSNGFELKTGNITIPNDKGVVFANGVNILSAVGAGAYGNTQVASYLLQFDGDIEFTSSTARIGNVDVITVMDSVQSPVYRFVNGGKITGIGNNLNIRTTTGVPSGPVTKISDNQGWDENNVGTNLPTTGGTGSGLTVDVVDGGSFYSVITINNPGSGYTNGDVITVTRPSISEIFSISVPIYDWTFGANGNVVLPADGTITFANGVNILSTIVGITSINTSVATSTISDESGDFSYGSLSYDYAVNGVTSGGFTISYSAPLVHGNVDVNVGNVIASSLTLANIAVPAHSYGAAGDTVGMIRVDSNYIYYCTSTYVPNSYTVGWDGATSNSLFIVKGAYPTPQVGWTVTQSIYTFTIDTVTDNGSNWALTYTGTPYGSPQGGTATLTNPVQPDIWVRTVWTDTNW